MTTTAHPDRPAASRATTRRLRRSAWVAGLVLAAATMVMAAALIVDTASDGDTVLLVGGFGSEQLISAAAFFAFAALAVGLCVIRVPAIWRLVLVPARVAAILCTLLASAAAALSGPLTVSPLVSDSCDTGYVVAERSFLLHGSGSVYRTDGILATRVARTVGDDGYQPIADGNYIATTEDGIVRVWHNNNGSVAPAPPSGAGTPAFALPERRDRTPLCGIDVAPPAGARPTTPPSPLALPGTRADVVEMLRRSLAASVGPVRAADGTAIIPEAVPLSTSACGTDGSASSLSLEFQTSDNAATLTQLLRVWDAAGYLPDRALHEDIRYSLDLPIQTMRIRDSTSIDGLLRIRIVGRCSAL